MSIDVMADEVRLLRDFLETQVSDLDAVLRHTRTPDYHESLEAFLRESFNTLDRELSEASSQRI